MAHSALSDKIVLISAKSTPACVNLESVKDTLRMIGGDLDEELDIALGAAIEMIEREVHRPLRVSYTIQESLPYFFRGRYTLDWQPVKSITSIKYYASDDTLETIATSNYRLLADTDGATSIELDSSFNYPATNVRDDAVQIIYEAGYTDIDSVPDTAKQAIKLKTRELFGDLTDREASANRKSVAALVNMLKWGQYR